MTAPQALAHERAFELLPWLVNGTLEAAERDAVEQHARACLACRRELNEQRRLHEAVHRQPAIHVSAHAGLKALDRELDGVREARRGRWALRYAALQPFAIAAAAGIAVLAVLLWFTPLPQPGAGSYSTLATPRSADSALIDVVFAQQTTAAEILALLDDIDGEIVAGPSELGRYSVLVANGRADGAELAKLIDTLTADPRVRFAARAFVEPAQ